MTTAAKATATAESAGRRARAALTAKRTAITGQQVPAKTSRSMRLAARLRIAAGAARAASSFTVLCEAPEWITLPPDQLIPLARAVTLALHADTIRKIISGDLLRAVTAIFGEAMVDRILTAPRADDAQPDASAVPLPLPADRREAEERGLAILALSAPPALACQISRFVRPLPIGADGARAAVADALRLVAPERPTGDSAMP